MFNYLGTERGRITTKILAVLLIITLTFVNFIMLGTYIAKWSVSIAAGEEPTSESNVIFSVYLDEGKTLKELRKDLAANDLKLYVSVEVKNQGKLENAKINLDNTNFYLKENKNSTSISLGTIQAGRPFEASYEIVAKKDVNYNLDWLNMDSTISLTGTYVSDAGNRELSADNTKNQRTVHINFNAPSEIGEEDNPNHKVQLDQAFITNKVMKVNNQDKRVIQEEIISNIVNNSYPIKSTNIEIEVPSLSGKYPESVKVSTYGTAATNGKYIEFGTKEEGKQGSYEYNEESHLLKIEVKNNPDENNYISWEQNENSQEVFDDFIVTYIYPEDVTTDNLQTKIKSKVTMYTYVKNSDDNYAEATKTISGSLEDKVFEPTLSVLTAEETYKGNMKIGNDTEFSIIWFAGVSDVRLFDSVVLNDTYTKDKFNDEVSIEPKTFYKTTYINAEEMTNMLGATGEIKIAAGEEEIIVNSDTQKGEGKFEGYYKVAYTGDITDIIIETSKPVREGTITILNEKVLKSDEELKQNLDDITSLTTYLSGAFFENNEVKGAAVQTNCIMKIQNTKTKVELGLDKKEISTTNETDVNFTITLKQDDIDCNLFKEPVITRELPSFVKTISSLSKENITLLNKNGTSLDIADVQIDKTGDNPKIIITLSGESTSYGVNPQITFKATLGTDKIVPTMKGNVKITVQPQGEESATVSKELVAKAESKILTATTVKVGEGTAKTAFKTNITLDTINNGNEEVIPVVVTETIINNTEADLSNVSVIGKVEKGLKANIKSIESAGSIYYTSDAEVNKNSNWVNEMPENATGYKVVFTSINDAETKTININLELAKNLEPNKTMNISYSVINGNQTVSSPVVTLNTPQKTNLELTVVPSIENGKTVYAGTTLTYNVTVKNTGNSKATNINVTNNIPQGTHLADGSTANWVITSLDAGSQDTRTLELVADELETDESKQIKVTTNVTQEYMEEDLKNTITNTVIKSPLKIDIKLLEGYDNVQLDDRIIYIISAKNTSGAKINNLLYAW